MVVSNILYVLGEDFQFDSHFFRWVGSTQLNHQETRKKPEVLDSQVLDGLESLEVKGLDGERDVQVLLGAEKPYSRFFSAYFFDGPSKKGLRYFLWLLHKRKGWSFMIFYAALRVFLFICW